MSDNKPWYHQGLRFECTQCGDCCTGAPGFVWVNKQEIAALAKRLELEVDEFERRYVRNVGVRKSLVEYDNGDCVFLDAQRRCTVYEDRPRQCKTWPFWDSNVATPDSWEDTCSVCPGCNHGNFVPLEEIQRRVRVIKL